MARKLFTQLNRRCIQPRSKDPNDQRREYIFNVLIGFFTLAAAMTAISSGLTHLLKANAHNANSVPVTAVFLAFTSGMWWLSRRGHYKIGAYVLVGLVLLAGLQLSAAWSVDLPMAELLNVLVIIVAGLVISSRAALITTAFVSVSTVALTYIQVNKFAPVDTGWLTKHLELSDAVGLVVVYMIVGAVSWLANNEIDSLLRRAWRSEKALAQERDQLEVTVAQRTRELEQTQIQKTLELQRFAEFGRVSANLVHDLASPLTAASLNLVEAGDKASTSLLNEAMVSLRQIESYIASSRKQLQGSSVSVEFRAGKEVAEVITLLRHQAKVAGVTIKLTTTESDLLFGDPVAFHRVLANLAINAIQSYRKSTARRTMYITMHPQESYLVIEVQDHGVGIKAVDLPHIFEDFYSSNKRVGRGLGIGLASAKRTIEQDFKGTITVTSTPNKGTLFTIGIPLYERSNTTKHTKRSKLSSRKSGSKRPL